MFNCVLCDFKKEALHKAQNKMLNLKNLTLKKYIYVYRHIRRSEGFVWTMRICEGKIKGSQVEWQTNFRKYQGNVKRVTCRSLVVTVLLSQTCTDMHPHIRIIIWAIFSTLQKRSSLFSPLRANSPGFSSRYRIIAKNSRRCDGDNANSKSVDEIARLES